MPPSPMAAPTPVSPRLSVPSIRRLSAGSSDEIQAVWTSGRDSPTDRHHRRRRSYAVLSPIDAQSRRLSSLSGGSGTGAPCTRTATPLPLLPTSPSFVVEHPAIDDPNDDADLSLPLISPTAGRSISPASANGSSSPERAYYLYQPKSLAGIALRSFCLGIALTIGISLTLATVIRTNSPLWRLPFFLAALSLFHFLEFLTTAAYNTRAADISSFLLTANWPSYAIAHSFASFECLVTKLLWPHRSWSYTGPLLCVLGFVLVLVGQTVRSVAMVQAGPSFNHQVQHQRGAAHVLVTSGIYARLRHPSYFGFFWWALGTQLVMGNLVSFFLYAAVLWKFFNARIRHEEELLIKFFGSEYVDYRKKVRTNIPFVP
ncbi:Isoprenylcysteine carboxyl methyltransferase family-domain-containing protein [Apodospora peruviana]|uniref:Protein-S-isoprenylcysteine O-methyltransferase n=1 Tax=Apodospora peruviana TaxID=516989 RepID=A0AAE0IBV0_9PEZI|nr:Isoprenylcysteine carboxyl methyltransferase family-domain-containing protein [Apodospora peruviana]